MEKLEYLDSKDLFGLNESQREEVLKSAVQVYIQQIELGALLIDTSFLYFLNENIIHTEKEIERLKEEEQYETCYFLQEIINRIKAEYDGLLV